MIQIHYRATAQADLVRHFVGVDAYLLCMYTISVSDSQYILVTIVYMLLLCISVLHTLVVLLQLGNSLCRFYRQV